jgi:hypothetical protein
MKIHLAIAPVLTLLLLAPSAAAQRAGAPKRADFFPLRVGDSWTYRHSEDLSEITVKVLSAEKQPDGTLRYLVEKLAGLKIDSWYAHAEGWVLLLREAYPEQEGFEIKYDPPKKFLKNPLVAGATWNWSGKNIAQADATELNKVIGPEVVKVPAGRFRTVKVVSRVTDGGALKTVTNWYADGVGLIKSQTEGTGLTYGWELVDYSFKKPGRRR